MTAPIQCGRKLSKSSEIRGNISRGHLATLPMASIHLTHASAGKRGWEVVWYSFLDAFQILTSVYDRSDSVWS